MKPSRRTLIVLVPTFLLVSRLAVAQLGYGPGGDVTLKLQVRSLKGGWSGEVGDGRSRIVGGTVDGKKPLDGFRLRGGAVALTYEAQVGGRWLGAVAEPKDAGVAGKPLEGLRIRAERGSVRYRASFVSGGGFSPWAADGEPIARPGEAVEAIEVEYRSAVAPAWARIEFRVLFRQGEWTEWLSGVPAEGVGDSPEALALEIRGSDELRYEVALSQRGWRPTTLAGRTAGDTSGQRRLEAIRVFGGSAPVRYRVKLEQEGWTPWYSDGTECGAVGRALKIQGIEIQPAR